MNTLWPHGAAMSLLCLTSFAPHAQATPPPETPVQLDTVVVQGERANAVTEKDASVGVLGNLPLIEAPYSVNVVNQHLLEIQQSTRYTDYLKNVPGANVGNVAIGFFSLRGFAVGTDGYLFDGLSGHVALSETYQLDSFDRIEVYKGPSAFLSGFGGATSLGGTLNYVPKRAGDKPVRSVELDYTSRALFSIGADVGERFGEGDQFGLRLNARYRDGEQQAKGYDWTQKSASLGLDWRASSTLRLAAQFEYADNHLPRLPPFFVVAPGVAVPRAPDSSRNIAFSWDDFSTIGKTAYARADWDFAKDWTLTAQALHSESERPQAKGGRFGFITDAEGTAAFGLFETSSKLENDSGQLLLRGKVQTGFVQHRLTAGVTAIQGKSSGGFAPTGSFETNIYRPVDAPEPAGVVVEDTPNGKSKGSSLLLSDIVELGEQWAVLVAARRAKFEQDNLNGERPRELSKTSPTAAVMFKPIQGALIYANYAEGLEQGGTAPMGTVNADERLAPLITEQIEVGAKLERGGMTYAVAYFDLKRPSEFVNGAGRFVQEGEQRHRGVELTATGRLLPGLDVVAGTAFIDPKNSNTGDPATEGRRPSSVPRQTANVFADYRIAAVPGLFVNAGAYHNAKQFLDGGNTQELQGWTRYDVGGRYETTLGRRPASLAFGIENIADMDYWIGQGGILTIADPLTVKVSLRLHW